MSVTGHASQGRCSAGRHKPFAFATGNLVLVKWEDGMVYFAKIKRIDQKREKCIVVFDDKSQDEANFSQIHSVDETTTDIICIKCKKDDSDPPNEIVLCDMCGIGFHQKCHNPPIPASALQLDIPWNCSYCQRGIKCPYLTESLDVLQNLLSDDNESTTCDEEEDDMESENDDIMQDESNSRGGGILRKRKGKKSSIMKNVKRERRKSLRHTMPAPELSSLVTVERKTRSVTHASEVNNASPTSMHSSNTFGCRSPSNDDPEHVTESLSGRKRKKHTNLYQKRMKRSSVESHTVSVTRIDTPIYADSSKSLFPPLSTDKKSPSSKEPSPISSLAEPETSESVNPEAAKLNLAKESPVRAKQKSFRVSLSLPDDADKRSLDKISDSSPLSEVFPPWDLFTPTVSPQKNINSPSVSKNVSITSDSSKEKQKNVREQEHAPFVASPLPNVSLNQLGINQTKMVPSMDVGVTESKIKSPTTVSTNSIIINSIKVPRSANSVMTVQSSPSVPKCVTTESSKYVQSREHISYEAVKHVQSPIATVNPDFSKAQSLVNTKATAAVDLSKAQSQVLNPKVTQSPMATAAVDLSKAQSQVLNPKVTPMATAVDPKAQRQVNPKVTQSPMATAVDPKAQRQVNPKVTQSPMATAVDPKAQRQVNPKITQSPMATAVDPKAQSQVLNPKVTQSPMATAVDPKAQRQVNPKITQSPMATAVDPKAQRQVNPKVTQSPMATAVDPKAQRQVNPKVTQSPMADPKAHRQVNPKVTQSPMATAVDPKAQRQVNPKVTQSPMADPKAHRQVNPKVTQSPMATAVDPKAQRQVNPKVTQSPMATAVDPKAHRQVNPKVTEVMKTVTPTPTTTKPDFSKTQRQLRPKEVKQQIQSPTKGSMSPSSSIKKGEINSDLHALTPVSFASNRVQGKVSVEILKIQPPAIIPLNPDSSNEVDSEVTEKLQPPIVIPESTKMKGEVNSELRSSIVTAVDSGEVRREVNSELQFSISAVNPDFGKVQGEVDFEAQSSLITPVTLDSSKEQTLVSPEVHSPKTTPVNCDSGKAQKETNPEQAVLAPGSSKAEMQGTDVAKEVIQSSAKPFEFFEIMKEATAKPRPCMLPFEKQTFSSDTSTRTPVITAATTKPHQEKVLNLEKQKTIDDAAMNSSGISKVALHKCDVAQDSQSSSVKSCPRDSVISSATTSVYSSPQSPDLDVIITGIETSTGEGRSGSKFTSLSRPKKKTVDALTVRNSPQVEPPSSSQLPGSTPVHCGSNVQSLYYKSTAHSEISVSPPQPAQKLTKECSVYTNTAPAVSVLHSKTLPQTRTDDIITHSHPAAGAAVYYSPDSVTVGSLSTTKPYAIVNALPPQSAEGGYRSIAVHQKPGQLVQVDSTTGALQLVARDVFQGCETGAKTVNSSKSIVSSGLPPPPTYSMFVAEKKKTVMDEDIQSIQKKIGDAFSCSSETMLVSAFEEAWGKFQANGDKYNKQKAKTFPTHKEVVKIQGTSAQMNLISTKPRLVAPKPSVKSSPITESPVSSSPQYIHAAVTPTGPPSQQQQIVFHSIPPEYGTVYASIPPSTGAGSSHQVHAAGLFYPAAVEVTGTTSGPPKHSLRSKPIPVTRPLVSQQRVIHKVSNKVHGQHSEQMKVTTNPEPQTKSTKQCAMCGKNATFLCSGCEVEWYCGRECQLKAWDIHADHCKA